MFDGDDARTSRCRRLSGGLEDVGVALLNVRRGVILLHGDASCPRHLLAYGRKDFVLHELGVSRAVHGHVFLVRVTLLPLFRRALRHRSLRYSPNPHQAVEPMLRPRLGDRAQEHYLADVPLRRLDRLSSRDATRQNFKTPFIIPHIEPLLIYVDPIIICDIL